MSTTLRQVLEHFEQRRETVSLPHLARNLGIERDTLQNMIDYWVRKGKLREVSAQGCTTCGSTAGCPFVVTLPHCYELVNGDTPDHGTPAPCNCGSCH